MNEDEYLERILKSQTLNDDEIGELKTKRREVQGQLSKGLAGVRVTIRWAGSKAKQTMIRASYDADIVVYVASDEDGAGSSLEEIYTTVFDTLAKEYQATTKTSAIRLSSFVDSSYLHIDVVPGRFFDESETDAWLHRTTGDKCRFKTNLDVHIETIRASGLRPLIRLFKLWAYRNGIACPTFVLELLVVDLGKAVRTSALADQMTHVMTKLRDEADGLAIEDPANPTGNDLSEPLATVKPFLQYHAGQSLAAIDSGDWEAVFGDVDPDTDKTVAALHSVAVQVKPSTQPWSEPR